ncbi:MMPL family transporter [Antarcticibacterium arcticum]|uniref:MMPL family transporter n=1 Tax=Antarcticibacterium arcticum TaxID=2585771 RepID=A0A5B8YGS7_9FLAO|nr:MMPL family transporter [Antarcticibacterium arcticum]QED36984.1 MMPL family transporter [Antarcticibacterium arcticum]
MVKLHQLIIKHKVLALTGLAIFIGVMAFLASSIRLEEDISNLIPAGEKQEVLKKVLANTEFSDKIIVTISSQNGEPQPDELTRYAQEFLDSVHQQLPDYITDIQGKIPEEGIREIYNFVYQNLPLFLNEADYNEISTRLDKNSIQTRMEENYKNLISPTGLVTKEYLFKDPLSLTSLGLKKLEELQVEDEFELYDNFLISKDHRHVLLFISPSFPASETSRNTIFLKELETVQQDLNRKYKGVKGDFFGGVLYSVANANQIKSDIKVTLGIAGVILLLILIFYYRKFYVPLLIFLPGILGGLTAIAVLFLLKGTISAISLGIGAVLLGISIDYSLHILTHYKNNNNIKKLYRDVTVPVLMSSTTTAIAFLCLIFLKSEALNDLGLFAAISVVVASLLALILIPVLYRAPVKEERSNTIIDQIAGYDLHKKTPVVAIMFVIFIVGLFFFTGVGFNKDLSAINFEPREIKDKEQNVQKIAGKAAKSIYLVSYGNSVDEALENNNSLYRELSALEQKEEINSFSSIGGVVLSTNTQLAKIEQWKEFWTPEKKQGVQEDLKAESEGFGFKPESFNSFYELLTKDFEPIYLDDYRNISNLYLDDFIKAGENFATVTTGLNLKPENKQKILNSLAEDQNMVVVDRKEINEGFLGNLKGEFNKLIGYSLIAVCFILLLFYRSLELTLLTLLPIGITWVITLGLLAILNIEFNILNIIISTFIFGLGLDYSIFITNAFLSEYETGVKVIKTYRTSILLSVITTLLGIGALFFAEHPALRSISIVSIIGVITALFVTFIIQGFIFQKLFIDRKLKGKAPFAFKNYLNPTIITNSDEKLYYRKEVYDNYRYKKDFPGIRRKFESDKERYLKVAEYLEMKDVVLHYTSGKGLLPVYLRYKRPGIKIVGVEHDRAKLQIALNTLSSSTAHLEFQDFVPREKSYFNVIIISEVPPQEAEIDLNRLIAGSAEKVIILDPGYSYRWIIDLNFEILYRQNEVVVLQKVE